MKITCVASALITDGDWILMVHLPSPQNKYNGRSDTYWGFPGGKVEYGEAVHQALIREVHEETGLEIHGVCKPVLRCVYGDRATWRCEVDLFHVQLPRDKITYADPDHDVLEVKWFTRDDALALIQQIPWAPMREPVLRYLSGETCDPHWQYQIQSDGSYAQF